MEKVLTFQRRGGIGCVHVLKAAICFPGLHRMVAAVTFGSTITANKFHSITPGFGTPTSDAGSEQHQSLAREGGMNSVPALLWTINLGNR